jgi:hypothetical protein
MTFLWLEGKHFFCLYHYHDFFQPFLENGSLLLKAYIIQLCNFLLETLYLSPSKFIVHHNSHPKCSLAKKGCLYLILHTNAFQAFPILFQIGNLFTNMCLWHIAQLMLGPHLLFFLGLTKQRQWHKNNYRLDDLSCNAYITHLTKRAFMASSRSIRLKPPIYFITQQSFHPTPSCVFSTYPQVVT